MDTILVVDPDRGHATTLERELRELQCRLILSHDLKTAIAVLQNNSVDVVVLAARPRDAWKTQAATLREHGASAAIPPAMICILRDSYRGPAEKLYGSRNGMKVIYEQF